MAQKENLKLTKQKSYFFINLREETEIKIERVHSRKKEVYLLRHIQAIALCLLYEIMQNERIMMEKTNAT